MAFGLVPDNHVIQRSDGDIAQSVNVKLEDMHAGLVYVRMLRAMSPSELQQHVDSLFPQEPLRERASDAQIRDLVNKFRRS
jgi:hypothetical protein